MRAIRAGTGRTICPAGQLSARWLPGRRGDSGIRWHVATRPDALHQNGEGDSAPAGAAERDLVIAALLHDVGKGQQQLWHRVAYVLLSRWSPRALQQLARPSHGWRAALARLRDHPLLGAAIARSLGYNETVCQLIEKHHSGPEDSRHRALQRADEVA